MHGFEWQDQRGVEGTGFVRALRSLLTAHLPALQADFERILKASFSRELGKLGDDGTCIPIGPECNPCLVRGETPEADLDHPAHNLPGFAHVQLFPMIKRTVTSINCFVFFGEDLCRVPDPMKALSSVNLSSSGWQKTNCIPFHNPGSNSEFTEAAMEFPQAIIFAAEFLRITPEFLRP
jgi:hypothetical protein